MTRCCPADAIVFGHTMCTLRPAWAADEDAAEDHDIDEYGQRAQWLFQAEAELRKSRKRGAGIDGAAPAYAGIPGNGPQAVSGDRGAAQGTMTAGRA